MKISKGKIILIIVVLYFVIFAIINVNKEKKINKKVLNKVIIVKNGKLDKNNEGKLVLVSGKISYDKLVSFDELDESFGTIKIKRTVEDYVKYKDETSNKYSYDWKERKESLEADDNFLHSIVSDDKISQVKIGDYQLDDKGLDLIPLNKYYAKQEYISDLTTKGLFYARDPWLEDIEEGDIRLTYKYYDLDKYPYLSVLAVQKGNSFVPYQVDKKTEVYQVFASKVDAVDKLEKKLKINVKNTKRGKSLFIIMIVGIGIFLIVDNKKNNKTSK